MNTTDITKLYEYTIWANHLTLDAVEKLSIEEQTRDVGISYQSIFGTLVHMMWAEWVWLARWKGERPAGPPNNIAASDLNAIRTGWQKIEAERTAFIAGLTDETLQADLHYADTKGNPYSLPLGLLLQHCANHATLHRGQIVGMIRQLGVAPPATDLIFYLYQALTR